MDKFKIRYCVDDGYAGPSRPHYIIVPKSDIEDLEDDELLWFFNETIKENFEKEICPYGENQDEFIEWARNIIKQNREDAQ